MRGIPILVALAVLVTVSTADESVSASTVSVPVEPSTVAPTKAAVTTGLPPPLESLVIDEASGIKSKPATTASPVTDDSSDEEFTLSPTLAGAVQSGSAEGGAAQNQTTIEQKPGSPRDALSQAPKLKIKLMIRRLKAIRKYINARIRKLQAISNKQL